jgi:hypothetical protein
MRFGVFPITFLAWGVALFGVGIERASEEDLVPPVCSPRTRLRRFRMRGFVRDAERESRAGHLVGADLVCELAHLEYPDPPIEERGRGLCQAPQPPHSVDHAVRKQLLDRPHRREVCPNLVQEVLEGVRVLSWEDDDEDLHYYFGNYLDKSACCVRANGDCMRSDLVGRGWAVFS